MMNALLVALALILSWQAVADEIEVPEEELARESVLPVFNQRRAVLNRNVLTDQRVELALGAGLELNEPFYNPYMFNGDATYNLSETTAINVQGLMWLNGLSSYGQQLRTTTGHPLFDASEAPHPSWAMIGNFEYIAYYGKISVAKDAVMNLNTFGIAGLGYLNMNAVGTAVINLGLGQNFFITNNFGIRWDLHWLIFQGPDPTSQPLTPGTSTSASSFGNRIYYNNQLDLALVLVL